MDLLESDFSCDECDEAERSVDNASKLDTTIDKKKRKSEVKALALAVLENDVSCDECDEAERSVDNASKLVTMNGMKQPQ